MEILKTALDWAKSELFSTPFFILFGIAFIGASIGFWQLGKTDIAKAYIIPTLVAGALLVIIGAGLYSNNKARVNNFENIYNKDSSAFIALEIARTESTLKEYKTVVFKIIPLIIIVAALLIIFVSSPTWRAISITVIAMMVILLLVDGTAHARINDYNKQLVEASEQGKK
jgi:hypothetical protein